MAALSDEEFEDRFGRLARLTPCEAAELLDGFEPPWWIVGGWAMEAFTGVPRDHEDVDVSILVTDLPELISHFIDTHHLWAAGSGMMSPILTVDQALPSWSGQVWIRESATEPWLLDINVMPAEGRRWVFRRDPSVVLDLERTLWRTEDGIRYQNPEIVLAFKAQSARAKDLIELEQALPLLAPSARLWLAETIARIHPGHAWLPLLER